MCSRAPRKRRTSENSVLAKFAECGFSALVPSFFDGAAPAETRAHGSDGQCQRSRLRHLLYPTTTSSTPMPRRRSFGIECTAYVLLTKPSARTSLFSHFSWFCRKI